MHLNKGEPKRGSGNCGWKSIANKAAITEGRTRWKFEFSLAIGLILLASALTAAADSCDTFPIALSRETLVGRLPGDELPDAFNGTSPGNFGWLTWAGSPSVPALVTSLTAPGDSARYVNPVDPNDPVLSVGDWVRGKPGVSNGKNVRDALDALKSRDIIVPVWDQARGSGNNAEYRVSGFARLRLLSYQLPGQSWLRARFLGEVHCGVFNQPPVVNAGPDRSAWVRESVALDGMAADDELPDGSVLSVRWVQVGGPGMAAFADPSSAATTVSFDLPGIYELRLTASDSEILSGDSCLIAVNQPNRPPVPDRTPVVTQEDRAVDFSLAAVDPDEDPLTFRILVQPAHGLLTGDPPHLRYAPIADYFGSDRFMYEVTDGRLGSGETEQVIKISALNDAPLADTQTLSTAEDLALPIRLSGSDVEGEALSFEVLDSPVAGSLTGVPPFLTYTPSANFFGSESFRFRVSDGALNSLEASVVVLVGEINDPPVALAQRRSLAEDSPLPVTLKGWDVEGSSLAFTVVNPPTHGAITGTPPHLTYVPALNHQGEDLFTFRVDDGVLESEAATVTFEITPVNDGPLARNGSVETGEDTAVEVVLGGIDVDGDPLNYEIVGLPAHGILSGAPPNLVFTPSANFAGGDELTFRVADGAASSEPASVSITVRPENDTPVAVNTFAEGLEDRELPVHFSASDADGDSLEYEILVGPNHGRLSGTPPHLIYAPTANFAGSDQVTYRVLDQASKSAAATCFISLIPVNDPPVATVPEFVTNEDQPVAVTLSGVDVEGDELSFFILQPPSHGVLSGSIPNLTYSPAADYHGVDRLTFRARDGALDSVEATVSIQIQPVNDPPTITIVSPFAGATFNEGTAVLVRMRAADDDAVARITLFANGNLLTELLPPSFEFNWINPPTGTQLLSAVAVDNEGVTANSSPVEVRVGAVEHGDFAVDAGPDQIIVSPGIVSLTGNVERISDGGSVSPMVSWSAVASGATAGFENSNSLQTTATFTTPGEYDLRLAVREEDGYRTDTVQIVVLPPSSERLAAARTHQGREFWFTMLNNHPVLQEPDYLEAFLVIQSEVDTDVTITIHQPFPELPPFEKRLRVEGGKATPIELPVDQTSSELGLTDAVVRNAIRVKSVDPVSLWLFHYRDDSSEGTLLLPTVLLGKEYQVMTYGNSPSVNQPGEIVEGSQFALAATETDTVVTISPAKTVGSRIAGVPYEVLLQPGETYRLIDQEDVVGDLTGTVIRANKPVSVFGGHTCANVPSGVAACNFLVEQLPPVETWGRRFLTLPLIGRSGGDTFRVLASADNTMLRIADETLRLDRGHFVERILVEPAEILSSRPILVAQFSNGGMFDSTAGDPSMTLVPPIEQFGGSHTFATPPPVWHNILGASSEVFTNYVNLVLPGTGLGSLRLDGSPISDVDLMPIGSSGYIGARVPIDPGQHQITASVPVGIWVYGWANFDAYGFLGGMFSDTIGQGVHLALSQSTSAALVGTGKTVTAQVTDEVGRPMADHQVEFIVSGANPHEAPVTSNPLGLAVFEYTGTTAGEDVIMARLAALEQSVTNTWIAASPNLPPHVLAGDDRAGFVTDTFALAATVADDGLPEGAGINVRWHTRNGPAAARFSDAQAVSTAVTFDMPGRYELALSVHDSEFETTEAVRVTVLDPVTLSLAGSQWNEEFEYWEPLEAGQAVPLGRSIQLSAALVGIPEGEEWTFQFLDGADLQLGGENQIVELAGLAPGGHSLSVRASGPHGLSIRSTPLLVHLTASPQIVPLAPLQDRVVRFDEALNIRATASDPDGTVASLAVYFGPWLIVEASGGELDFAGLLPGWGTQSLRFVAIDNLGLAFELATVQITITPPVVDVALTAPDPAQSVRLGMPIVFAADAVVGAPAAVSVVIFEWWGPLPWEWFPYWHYGVAASEPPYTATLDPFNFNYPLYPGSYQYRARAVATFDGIGVSAPITINVLPTIGVAIASPANGAVVYTGRTYPIELNVDDPTGVFASAEFSINGGQAISRPEPRLDWTPTAVGNHIIGARVHDHRGYTYDAAETATVQVVDPPVPEAQIVEPADGATLPAGRLTFVFGEVTDPAGVVTNLTLLVNGVAMQSGRSAAFTWKPEASANYRLELMVQDRLGRQATSPAIAVTTAPEIYVGISQPQEGDLLPLGEELEVTANVSDSGNMMQRLELLADNVKVDEADHIHLRWTPATAGPHTLQVVAWDWQGGSHPSVVIPVTVALLIRPTIQLLTPAGGTSWVANQPVSLAVASSDSDGAVIEVEIRSNGKAILTTNQASFAFAWLDATPGWHELVATARDDTAQFARTDPVRIWVEHEELPGVAAPGNLRAVSRRPGHTLLWWDPVVVPGLSGYAVLRRTEPDGEWRQVGRTEPGKHFLEQAILSARTVYTYQVKALIGNDHQSGPASEVTVRTRAVMPEYGVLDLTELVIGAGTGPSALVNGSQKPNRSTKPGRSARNGSGQFTSLDSFSPVDRGPFRVLGISDANEILFAHDDGKFTLWFPGGADDLTIPGFQPVRVTRSGVVVGSVIVDVTAADGTTRPERRAARWDRVNGVRSVGGDPKLNREPAAHAPLSQPYDAFHLLTDVNAQGQFVGQASYVYFLNSILNNDADPNFIANHATLWLGNGSVNLGGVTVLNGFSRAAAINDAGLIVGWGAITGVGSDGQPLSTQTHAARSDGRHWSASGGMVDLGTLGGSHSAALDVNNSGLAVGYSTLHPEDPIGLSQAALWLPASTQPVQLPNLGGTDLQYPDGYGYATAVNDANLIVGESVRKDGAMAATLWQRIAEPEESGDPGIWEAEDLNVLADDDVWLLTNARDINSSGLIVGQGIKWIPNPQHPEQGQWELRAFLLVPGSLLTDANRDGVIDTRPGSESEDRNRVSRLNPWRFWINNDKDTGDAGRTSKTDVPGSLLIVAPPFGGNLGSISGVRDLVDYFPLCLDIGRLLTLFPPAEFEYIVEQQDAAIRFAETTLSPADSDAYLRDVAVAKSLVPGLLRAPRSQFSPGSTSDGRLSPAFLAQIASSGAGVLLIEGRKNSPHPIRLELHRAGKPVLKLFFGLSVSPVVEMFRFKNLLASAGGPSLPGDRLAEPSNYPDDLGSDKNFVFLHGYNVTMDESRGWQSEMFKRLFWSGSRARFHGVSWYGYQTKLFDSFTPDYHVNVENAFQTSGDLAAFLAQVSATGGTTVAAHSLGNMVVSAALQDWNPPIENYFMLDAAVALEAYDAGETRSRSSPNHNMVQWEWDTPAGAYKESLRASEWYTLFPDGDHRRSLTWRGRFDRVPLANVWNYYSSGEEVLAMHPQRSSSSVIWNQSKSLYFGIVTSEEVEVETARFAWVLQEKNKGRGVTLLGQADPIRLGSSDIGGWEFNDADYFVQIDDHDIRRMRPAEANAIDPMRLRTKPFFRMGRELELYGSDGSEYARIHRDRLLGEMIPARSLPAGANPTKALRVGFNLDMNRMFKLGWPQSRGDDEAWRHSDITDVSYLHVWPLFKSFVDNAALNR